MKKGKAVYKINNFIKAIRRLKEAINLKEGNPLGVDAVIKRFEFTFEMAWKSVKTVLEYEGVSCKTPRECLKKAYQFDYIEAEEIWLNMLEDRNLISHIYDQKEAEALCKKIGGDYIKCMEKLEKIFQKRLEETLKEG